MDEELSPFIDNGHSEGGLDSDREDKLFDRKLFSVTSPKRKKTLLLCLLAGVVLLAVVLVFSGGLAVGRFAIPQSQPESKGPCTSPAHNTTNTHEICSNPPLLLISLDGFWSGYLERSYTPFIKSLAANGVRAEYMRSEFPTKTFPNHFSIVTGLHPESHGIVNNYFYDKILKDKFFINSTHQNDPKWWLGEPVWVTAVKQGLKSGVYFWPGSEVKIEGVYPTYFFPYKSSTTYEERVDTVLSWLDFPSAARPQFMAAYFDEPDEAGHAGGPNSDLVNGNLTRVDKTVERLFAGLKERGVEECVNVIIVSDHGMATYDPGKLVHLNELLPANLTSELNIIYGVVADIYASQGAEHNKDVQETYDFLVENGTDAGLPFRAYHEGNLPLRLHAGHFNKQRYGDIYLIGDEGSYLTTVDSSPVLGEHGYDNILTSVQAIFIAHGPAFKKGYVAEGFGNIELYNLMCGLLGITPSPNNGTTGALNHILTPSLLTTLPPPQIFQGSPGVYDSCSYPTDELTYNTRSFCQECVCRSDGKCADVSNNTLNESNRLLNLTATQEMNYQKMHLLWGVPSGGEGSGSCLLTQQDYVTLYSNALHIPLWSAFKLSKEQAILPPSSGSCLRRDPRVPPTHSSNCSDYTSEEEGGEFVPVRLTAALSTPSPPHQLTTNLLTNVVPQMAKFNTGVWSSLQELLKSWAVNFTTIHVIMGSALDVNRDGERDSDVNYTMWVNGSGGVAIPTHFYAVVVRCINDDGLEPSDCESDQLDAVGLLLQHPTEPGDPSPLSKLLRFSLTPIRDIERLTGVNFFPDLSPQQQNTLELRLTNKLWTSP